jgi:hypothetical protein
MILGFRITIDTNIQGRIQDFKLGGTHLKKLRRAEGGVKMFRVFRVNTRQLPLLKSRIIDMECRIN